MRKQRTIFVTQQHTKILEMHLNLLRSTKFSQGVLSMADILNTSGSTAVAFFRKYSDALTAISELKDTGFTSSEIGLVTSGTFSELDYDRDYDEEDDIQLTSNDRNLQSTNLESAEGIHTGSQRHSQDRGMWEKIKDFFTGEEESYRGDDTAYNRAFQHLSGSEDRALLWIRLAGRRRAGDCEVGCGTAGARTRDSLQKQRRPAHHWLRE